MYKETSWDITDLDLADESNSEIINSDENEIEPQIHDKTSKCAESVSSETVDNNMSCYVEETIIKQEEAVNDAAPLDSDSFKDEDYAVHSELKELCKQQPMRYSMQCVLCHRGFHSRHSLHYHIKHKHKIGLQMYSAVETGAVHPSQLNSLTLVQATAKMAAKMAATDSKNDETLTVIKPVLKRAAKQSGKVARVKKNSNKKQLMADVVCPNCGIAFGETRKVSNRYDMNAVQL